MITTILGVTLGISLAYNVKLYQELWKWARQCQGARIAIAYKNRVKMQAPLVEWLQWCNQLDEDKDSNGRVVWRMGHASVAIVKKPVAPKSWRKLRKPKPAPPLTRTGTWRAKDDTPAENKATPDVTVVTGNK